MLDGGLAGQSPAPAGKPITISLNCHDEPPKHISELIWIAQKKLEPYGISVTVELNSIYEISYLDIAYLQHILLGMWPVYGVAYSHPVD